MISNEQEACAAGYSNYASYRHDMKMAAERESRQRHARNVAQRQAALTKALQHVPGNTTTLHAQVVDPVQRRSMAIQQGLWPRDCGLHGPETPDPEGQA